MHATRPRPADDAFCHATASGRHVRVNLVWCSECGEEIGTATVADEQPDDETPEPFEPTVPLAPADARDEDDRWRVLLDAADASDADVLEGLALLYEQKAAATARQSPDLVGTLPERQRHAASALRRAHARLSSVGASEPTDTERRGASLIHAIQTEPMPTHLRTKLLVLARAALSQEARA